MPSLVGVAQWCLDCSGLDAIARTEELHLSAIHLDFRQPGEDSCLIAREWRLRYLEASARYGVALRAIAINAVEQFGTVSEPASSATRKCRDLVHAGIDAAVEMEVALLYIPSFHANEIRNENELAHTADFLREACAYAETTRVDIATENTLDVPGNRRLLEGVGHPKLRLLVDLYNPVLWEHDARRLIEALREFMCDQVHVKDGCNGVMGNARLGDGDGSFHDTAACLAISGSAGTLILENDYHVHATRRVAHDLAVLRRYFDIEPTPLQAL